MEKYTGMAIRGADAAKNNQLRALDESLDLLVLVFSTVK